MEHIQGFAVVVMSNRCQNVGSEIILPFIIFLPGVILIGLLIYTLADVLPVARRFSRPACPNYHQPFAFKACLLEHSCPNYGEG